MEQVIKKIGLDQEGVRLGEIHIGLLAYVDDIVLLMKNKEQLKG